RAFATKFGVPLEWTDGQSVFDDASVPTRYTVANPSGAGTIEVSAPSAPAGYTAVRYGGSVAFVPATAGAAKPAEPPHGYVAYEHPDAGTVYLPERYAADGKPSVPFGTTAVGMPAPAVEVGASYGFTH